MEIGRLLKRYQTSRRSSGLSENTISRVILNVRVFADDTDIESTKELTTDLALRWGEAKLKSGLRSSTLYTYFNSLRSFLNFCDEVGAKYPANKDRLHCRPHYKRKLWLKPYEIRRLIRFADPTTALLIKLMFATGLRISEATSLKRSDLQDDGVIYVKGKGGEVNPVFVTGELFEELASLETEDLFIDPNGRPMDRRSGYYYVKKAMERAGFPNHSPHSIRHSFCTDLLRNGADLSHVSRLMRHKNIAVTQIYTHLITDDIQKTHAKYLTVI